LGAHGRGGHHHDYLKRLCNWAIRQWPDATGLGKLLPMVNAQHLDSLNAEQLRALAKALIDQAASRKELLAGKDRQAKIDQLTHEMAVLKRWKFGRSGERLDPPQRSSTRSSMRTSPLSKWNSRAWHPRPEPSPRRASPDAPGLPRVEITHKPESTVCTTPGCGCTLKRIQSKFCPHPPSANTGLGPKRERRIGLKVFLYGVYCLPVKLSVTNEHSGMVPLRQNMVCANSSKSSVLGWPQVSCASQRKKAD
jgi:hypothetical protein